ncbi:MFS transporter [Citrobacter freundii]|uniref:MFS transporter n=1 Tax=Citrobacter freundii TaxID=546 RepID=A0AAE7GXK2_CITFR|nr:MFS transporter [Citrobacter freundii]QLO16080.1 MFS transporter [Citrobacter freundii]
MELSIPGLRGRKWTCADLLSSYRFWSIFTLFILISIICTLGSTYNMYFWQSSLGITPKASGLIIAFGQLGTLMGFMLAWFLCRLKNRYSLYIIALLLVAGTVITFLVKDASGLTLLTIGQFLIAASQGAISLLLPALIAVATGSIEIFVIIFGLCSLIKLLTSTYLIAFIFQAAPENILLMPPTLAIVALVLTLPIKNSLFFAPPPEQKSSTQRPERAEPAFMALLALIIPFYMVYWFVKIHREIQFVKPSSQLMTAFGAGWVSVLMPFGCAILCMTLNDELLSLSKEQAGIKTGWVLFWTLLCPPLGVALIQIKMNNLIAVNNESLI